jgi:hypothetical protein
MGKPVRIYDLAERMISLSGFIPHDEIKIIETGLRPGEKLYEEMLADKESTLPTSNKKIKIGKIRPYDYHWAESRILDLIDHIEKESDSQLVTRMKEIVPEFISQNSQFEKLDDISPEMQPAKEIEPEPDISIFTRYMKLGNTKSKVGNLKLLSQKSGKSTEKAIS